MPAEDRVWEGAVSQFDNINRYLVCGALCAVTAALLPTGLALTLIPAVLSIILWLAARTRNQRCLLTTRRLVFDGFGAEIQAREIELGRIREIRCLPSLLGVFNLGSIELVLSNGQTCTLPTLHGARELHKHLCARVKGCKGCHASLFPHDIEHPSVSD